MNRFTLRLVKFLVIAVVLFSVAAFFGAPGVVPEPVLAQETPYRIFAPSIAAPGAAPGSAVVAQETGACLIEAAGRNLQCTANDVRIARFLPPAGVTECNEGETINVAITAQVQGGSKERYDIGIWVGLNGGSALTGQSCYRDYLPIPPFTSLENTATDTCGDIRQGELLNRELQAFELLCQDTDNDGFVDVNACASWDNQRDGNLCTSATETVPNTPSKCRCENVRVDIAVNQSATIEVIKDLVPSTDPGLFNLQIDGTTRAADVGDGGTTGPVTVSAGTNINPGATHTVAETAGTGTSLDNYNSSLSCLEEGGSPTPDTDGTLTVNPGDKWTCTFTNTRKTGAILVTKTRKHAAAGPGDHPHPGVTFTVNGQTGTTAANGQVCFDGLPFGTYNVVETVPSGYVADGPTSKPVTVDNEATCAGSPFAGETVSFSNMPLTNITVSVDSQVDGGTASTINCIISGGGSVASGSTGPNGDGSATAPNLSPGTYICTIVVDP